MQNIATSSCLYIHQFFFWSHLQIITVLFMVMWYIYIYIYILWWISFIHSFMIYIPYIYIYICNVIGRHRSQPMDKCIHSKFVLIFDWFPLQSEKCVVGELRCTNSSGCKISEAEDITLLFRIRKPSIFKHMSQGKAISNVVKFFIYFFKWVLTIIICFEK